MNEKTYLTLAERIVQDDAVIRAHLIETEAHDSVWAAFNHLANTATLVPKMRKRSAAHRQQLRAMNQAISEHKWRLAVAMTSE